MTANRDDQTRRINCPALRTLHALERTLRRHIDDLMRVDCEDAEAKDSPVNGTFATVFRADGQPMRLGENGLGVWKRFPDKPKHRSGPAAMAFFSHWSRPTPSRPVPGLWCLASDAAQRL